MSANTVVWKRNKVAIDPSTYKFGTMSPAIWGDDQFSDLMEGVKPGFIYRYDPNKFKLAADVAAAVAYWSDGHVLFGSTGAAVAATAAQGGGRTFSSDGDNEGVSFAQVGLPFQIAVGKKKLWWEIELERSSIDNTKLGIFAGLIDTTALTAILPIEAAGTLADVNLVGFHALEADGDQFDTVYKANTVTQVTVQADCVPSPGVVAATKIRLGMVFDPDMDDLGSNYLSFYVNNLRTTTSKQIPTAAGTDFPNDVQLTPVFALLNATASTPGNVKVTQFQCAQLF